MNLKKGWVEHKINDAIIQIGTPYWDCSGDQITFYITSEWLDDDGAFWFAVSSRFIDGTQELVEFKIRIMKVLTNYDYIEFANMQNNGRIYRSFVGEDQVYAFGECLKELYALFESEGNDERKIYSAM